MTLCIKIPLYILHCISRFGVQKTSFSQFLLSEVSFYAMEQKKDFKVMAIKPIIALAATILLLTKY